MENGAERRGGSAAVDSSFETGATVIIDLSSIAGHTPSQRLNRQSSAPVAC